MHSIIIELRNKNDIDKFSIITQYECTLNCEVNSSMQHVLCRQIGIPEDYFNRKIQTIFLNGNVVDSYYGDIVVHNKDRIALSAAMPGLVGSMLRKKGCLSPMRSAISLSLPNQRNSSKNKIKGLIILKLFNLVSKDIGPSLLFSGKIIMNTFNLMRALKRLMRDYPNIIKIILFDKLKLENESLKLRIERPLYKNSMLKVI